MGIRYFLNSIYFMLIDASSIFPHHMSFMSCVRNGSYGAI